MEDINISDEKLISLVRIIDSLAHPIRFRIACVLERKKSFSFTELLKSLKFDPTSQCGLLDYHLKRMLREGAVKSENGRYMLTGLAAQLLKAIKTVEYIEEREDYKNYKKLSPKEIRIKRLNKKLLKDFLDLFTQLLESKYRQYLTELGPENRRKIISSIRLRLRELEDGKVIKIDNQTYRRISLVALAEENIVGIITGLTCFEEPLIIPKKNVKLRDKVSTRLKKYIVTGIWIRPNYYPRTILRALIKALHSIAKDTAWIEYLLLNELLSEQLPTVLKSHFKYRIELVIEKTRAFRLSLIHI